MSTPDLEKDYYFILGAEQSASQDEIERLYKRLAKRHHPDRGGDAEEMKAINEAYRVLGNAASRHAYDSRRAYQPTQRSDAVRSVASPLSRPPEILPNTVSGQLVGASFILLAGLAFLFLVKIYYIRFMWPIFVGAALVVVFGIWRAHRVIVLARKTVASTHPLKTHIWIQEIAFWLMVCAGSYFIYLVMSAI
jgi:DnaJ domain